MHPTIEPSSKLDWYYIPNPEKYVSKITEYQPEEALLKLKEPNIEIMLAKVPEEIKSKTPIVTRIEMLGSNKTKVVFDIVNYSTHQIGIDDTLFITIDNKFLTSQCNGWNCTFSADDCQLVIYENEQDGIVLYNKDVPNEGCPRTHLGKMTIHQHETGFSYMSSNEGMGRN